MTFLEGIPISLALGVVAALGTPGLAVMFLFIYQSRTDKILRQYKADVDQVARFYENNVELVTNYRRLADDLSSVIHLNTQAQTQLVEQIKHNMFCPIVREKGPNK